MKWIKTSDLQQWLTEPGSATVLPLLFKKLVRFFCNDIEEMHFSYGDYINEPGWDGVLKVGEKTMYLPGGGSLWEFSKNVNKKANADENYSKRTKDPLGYDPKDYVFIYIVPRKWQNAKAWAAEKRKENIWKDVLVIDQSIMDQMLEDAAPVAAWFAVEHLRTYPQGVQSAENFWKIWAAGTITPQLLLAGRDKQCQELIKSLSQNLVIPVQANTTAEALAFIISTFKAKSELEEDFFSRAIIVDSSENFKQLAVSKNRLILIPRFEDSPLFKFAAENGHLVIPALDFDCSLHWQNLQILPKLEREGYLAALQYMGFSRQKANTISKETARDITILRRYLKIDTYVPNWAKPENVMDVVPALLVGRWDENSFGDRQIVAEIAGMEYEKYISRLSPLTNISDAPVLKFSNCWRLTSTIDAWYHASKYIPRHQFEILKTSFLKVMGESNPAFELPAESRLMASVLGKSRSYSGWIRDGLCQSLMIISVHHKNLKTDLPSNGEAWVDAVVAQLLNSDSAILWKSIDNKLPWLAEASPRSFISALENNVLPNDELMTELSMEEPAIIIPKSYISNFLWAVEAIAWLPDYLTRATLVLGKMAAKDKGKSNRSNRPINSLAEIFKSWHFQTFADLNGRIAALKLLSSKQPDVAWELCLNLLPGYTSEYASGTHKFRWRFLDQELSDSIPYTEIWTLHSALVNLLIEMYNGSEDKLADLITHSKSLGNEDQKLLIEFINEKASSIQQNTYTAWEAVKRILSMHRTYPDESWSKSEEVLRPYQLIYNLLEPKNLVDKHLWMFNTTNPEFQEGLERNERSWEEVSEITAKRRAHGLEEILNHYGVSKIIELSSKVTEPWIYGDTLSIIVNNLEDIVRISELLQGTTQEIKVAQAFIIGKCNIHGFEWVCELFTTLSANGLPKSASVKIFLNLYQSQEIWDFIDMQGNEFTQLFWNELPPIYRIPIEDRVKCIENLHKVKRFFSAIDVIAFDPTVISSELLTTSLKLAISEPSSEKPGQRIKHTLDQVISELDKRTDITEDTLVELEWLYLPILNYNSTRKKPKLLHKKLVTDPQFFVDVLKMTYKPEDKELLQKETQNFSAEELVEKSKAGDELLSSCIEMPGQEKNTLSGDSINLWVDKVRNLAKESSRLDMADFAIGKLLAKYPDNSEFWPPKEISAVIERIGSKKIKSGFYSGIFGKRGLIQKAVFEGGRLERAEADKYKALAAKQMDNFPIVGSILEDVAKNYMRYGELEDEDATRDSMEY